MLKRLTNTPSNYAKKHWVKHASAYSKIKQNMQRSDFKRGWIVSLEKEFNSKSSEFDSMPLWNTNRARPGYFQTGSSMAESQRENLQYNDDNYYAMYSNNMNSLQGAPSGSMPGSVSIGGQIRNSSGAEGFKTISVFEDLQTDQPYLPLTSYQAKQLSMLQPEMSVIPKENILNAMKQSNLSRLTRMRNPDSGASKNSVFNKSGPLKSSNITT